MEYTLDTEIEFVASLGFVGADREEILTLRSLGCAEADLEDMTNDEIEHMIGREFEEWVKEITFDYSGWRVKE